MVAPHQHRCLCLTPSRLGIRLSTVPSSPRASDLVGGQCGPWTSHPPGPRPAGKKSFIDFQRLTTTHSSDIVLMSLHFLFTLTLTFFATPSASTTCRQTSFCQDFSLFMEGPHSDSLGQTLAPCRQPWTKTSEHPNRHPINHGKASLS